MVCRACGDEWIAYGTLPRHDIVHNKYTTVKNKTVIPAEAGTQLNGAGTMGPSFRRDDDFYSLTFR
jgi:hypothetical protein